MRRSMTLWIGVAAVGAVLLLGAAITLLVAPSGHHGTAAGTAPGSSGPGGTDLLGSGGPAGSASPSPSTNASAPPSIAPTKGAMAPPVFAHPGVMVSRAQLDFMRGKVLAGAQPWASAYNSMKSSAYASLSRTPAPRADVDCGPSSNPDIGCSDERQDALAAYADALVWYVSRDPRYATEAINLMDAWSATLKTHTNHNTPLQTGWAGAGWSRAAELIKWTYPAGWPNAGRFATLLRTVYLPVLINGSGANGNWELIMTDALMGISVFLDDKASFNKALALWRGRVPAYIYLKSDGPAPLSPPGRVKSGASLTSYWYGQTTLVDGLAQETCRDFGHAAMGINAAFHAAETARAQGVDLWGEQKNRFAAALEFHAPYEMGEAAPSWLCGGTITRGTGGYWEEGYNALHNRLGMALPNATQLMASRRPTSTDNHSSAWETLTAYGNPY
jgi:alginate lyase